MAVGKLNRDDAEDICKSLTVALVVVQLKLNLRLGLDCLPKSLNSDFVDSSGCFNTLRAARSRSLQKAAVPTEGLSLGIASELAKGVRCVDDGRVREFHVADNEGHGAVYSADVNGWMWSASDRDLGVFVS